MSTAVSTPVPPAPPVRSRSRGRFWAVTVIVLGALGFLVFRGLGNATLYFRTADQAVHQHASLGTKRFRIEGTVVRGTVHDAGDDVVFAIEQNGATVDVRHRGDPPQLFKEGIPVVLEGRFATARPDDDRFLSDRIMVKHSEVYRARHPDRVKGSPDNP